MRAPQDYGQLATDLAMMARELVGQDSMQGTLEGIVNHAVRIVAGCDAADIMTIRNGEVVTLASAGTVSGLADLTQPHREHGPWADPTIRGGRMYRIEDTHETTDAWPLFCERARAVGVGSVMGFLLHVTDDRDLGALELYAGSRGAFRDDSEHVGWLLASHVAVALASARHAVSLDSALASSRTIGEAIGLVRARYGLDEHARSRRSVEPLNSRTSKSATSPKRSPSPGSYPNSRLNYCWSVAAARSGRALHAQRSHVSNICMFAVMEFG